MASPNDKNDKTPPKKPGTPAGNQPAAGSQPASKPAAPVLQPAWKGKGNDMPKPPNPDWRNTQQGKANDRKGNQQEKKERDKKDEDKK